MVSSDMLFREVFLVSRLILYLGLGSRVYWHDTIYPSDSNFRCQIPIRPKKPEATTEAINLTRNDSV